MAEADWAQYVEDNFPGARITSGLRTLAQNTAAGGVGDSAHLRGDALDFVLSSPGAMQQAVALLSQDVPGVKAIYEGPGAAHSTGPHVHLDFTGASEMPTDTLAPAPQGAPAMGMSADEKKLLQTALDKQKAGEALTAEEVASNEKFGKEYGEKVNSFLDHEKLSEQPKAPELPQEELPEVRNPASALTQFLPLLAIFGGALTKGAANGAMSAAIGVMEGQQSGDIAARDRAHQQWEDHMKTISDQYKLQRDEFDDMLKLADKDTDRFKDKLGVFTMQHDLTQANAALQRGDIKNTIEIVKAGLGASSKMDALYGRAVLNPKIYSDEAGQNFTMNPLTGGFTSVTTGQPYTPVGQMHTVTGQARSVATQIFQDWRNSQVKALGKPPTPQEEKQFTAQYGQMNRQATEMVSGKESVAVRAFNTAINHLDTLRELFEAQENGNTPLANSIGLLYAKETGQPAPTSFSAARALVANEIIKAIQGGGGALTDRQDAQAELKGASSPAQMAGVIDTYQKLMGGQLQSVRQMYDANGGEDVRPFESYLEPRAMQVLSDMGVDQPKPEPGPSPAAAPGNIATPKTKEDFDALPKGAHYSKPSDPPGSYRVKS